MHHGVNIKINNIILAIVAKFKYLGVILGSRLGFYSSYYVGKKDVHQMLYVTQTD